MLGTGLLYEACCKKRYEPVHVSSALSACWLETVADRSTLIVQMQHGFLVMIREVGSQRDWRHIAAAVA